MQRMNITLSREELDEIMREHASSGKREITYEEFAALFETDSSGQLHIMTPLKRSLVTLPG
eukprot:CAMPEP_0176380894 /NCGR_PEP_ID=MMETSP0126-20121128/31453_1 /TAXON_ID=141414 ORGANISM="Strombidinopsis acuminatum, Strain SPMC142" /NCGR_SAMPLE_ID=MMETSP0126 /ASSEMBLY_ACC=CAM_ASM_000229 /LENGTH=60 /DNA_ID=CAMNT_0017744405 /DNA_START=101 /DNA_END=283 /DNA_ORIENTATION=+